VEKWDRSSVLRPASKSIFPAAGLVALRRRLQLSFYGFHPRYPFTIPEPAVVLRAFFASQI
jgi:hypothetical protein